MTTATARRQPPGRAESDGPIAVTGAGGFIGSHVVEELISNGHEVRALVRYKSSGSIGMLADSTIATEAVESGQLVIVRGDVTAVETIRELLKGCSSVLHLAALIGIPYSYLAPSHYVAVNVVGTMNVLDVAREGGLSRVVLTSTSETLGTAQSELMDESHPLVAQSPYAATKIAADKLGESYFRSFGTPVVTLRPFNTYGPRQSQRAVIPTIISQLLVGNEVSIGNTQTRRDFMYVQDTARAFRLAATVPAIEGRTFHVGTGRDFAISDVISLVGSILGRDPKILSDERRTRPDASEVNRLVCDITAARRTLLFDPRVDLEHGLAETIAYWKTVASQSSRGEHKSDYVI